MKIAVTTKPGARVEKVEHVRDNDFVVAVKEPPIEGRANEAVIRALADYFRVAPSRIRIVGGHKSKKKIVEIVG